MYQYFWKLQTGYGIQNEDKARVQPPVPRSKSKIRSQMHFRLVLYFLVSFT